ncbi:hypothetical protein [Nocardia sienata]|uniref:hypothetical protein n=1 Tax=Nocardia sienata TaxID=248552 RepID=UPI000B0D0ED1|nr:hypothetical protein [Nocardia sienata]
MNWNGWLRRAHRVLAMIFTVALVITVVVPALQGPEWVSYLSLPPLALLFFSGAYLYARSLVALRRDGEPVGITPRSAAQSLDRPSGSRVRQLHRWAAVAFTVAVPATFVALSIPEPVVWVSYLPLIPLALLFFSGLYQFVLPYRNSRSAGASDQRAAAA